MSELNIINKLDLKKDLMVQNKKKSLIYILPALYVLEMCLLDDQNQNSFIVKCTALHRHTKWFVDNTEIVQELNICSLALMLAWFPLDVKVRVWHEGGS